MHNPDTTTPTSEKDIDEAVKETFPASDPPSFMSGSTAAPTAATVDHAARTAESTVTIYRVVGEDQREKPFGASAAQGSGRWTSKDAPAVYASTTAATALLEFLAHCDSAPPAEIHIASAHVPKDRLTELTSYPAQWRERPYRADVQAIGDEWVRSHRSLGLQVPSALCEGACNVLINPAHVDAPLLQQVEVRTMTLDERLRRIGG